MRVEEQARKLAEEILASQGMELVHLEFVTEGRNWVLRLFIDREGGVTIEDCVAVSRQLGYELDVADFIRQAYSLEVSSPGIDRVVGKREDFERFAGEQIRIKLKRPMGNRRKITGELLGIDGETGDVLVREESGDTRVPMEAIRRANLIREPQIGDGSGQKAEDKRSKKK